jgi:pyrimidine operon attenuation protein/uracil phosphoribosyltransferase
MPQSTVVLDAADMGRTLARMAHEIAERNQNSAEVVLVGIQRRGVFFARRLAAILNGIWNHAVPIGELDVSMHRDDLEHQASRINVRPTVIPFDITGKTVILADDVLFSGRTTRAALDSLNDFGRPKRIQLAVLVDRGHRELPIKADFVGRNLPTAPRQRINARFQEADGVDEVTLENT